MVQWDLAIFVRVHCGAPAEIGQLRRAYHQAITWAEAVLFIYFLFGFVWFFTRDPPGPLLVLSFCNLVHCH